MRNHVIAGLAAGIALGGCAPEGADTTSHEASVHADARDTGGGSAVDAATPTDGAPPESSMGVGLDAAGFDAGAAAPDTGQGDHDAETNGAADAATESGSGSDDAGSSTNATPSAGCGKSGRPAGGRVSVVGDHNFTFPAAYDGQRPFPLLVGFHAASNPIEQIENLTKGSDFEQSFVRAFPKSKGSAWDYNTDIAKVIALYTDLMANYCIDTSRIFATGHSSGAQLIVQILTPGHQADADRLKFRAVAPVAASRYGTVSRAIPVLYVQGAHDSVRNGNGADVVKEFATANGCATTSKPHVGPMCMSGSNIVTDGCVQYDGCRVPTVWCSHDDPAYSNTNHGWPCFATKAMYDFFTALP